MTAQPAQPLSVDGFSPNGKNPSALLDADQLAARWQVPKSQVYRLAREGRLPTVRIGRYYRWRLAAIEAWELDSESAVG